MPPKQELFKDLQNEGLFGHDYSYEKFTSVFENNIEKQKELHQDLQREGLFGSDYDFNKFQSKFFTPASPAPTQTPVVAPTSTAVTGDSAQGGGFFGSVTQPLRQQAQQFQQTQQEQANQIQTNKGKDEESQDASYLLLGLANTQQPQIGQKVGPKTPTQTERELGTPYNNPNLITTSPTDATNVGKPVNPLDGMSQPPSEAAQRVEKAGEASLLEAMKHGLTGDTQDLVEKKQAEIQKQLQLEKEYLQRGFGPEHEKADEAINIAKSKAEQSTKLGQKKTTEQVLQTDARQLANQNIKEGANFNLSDVLSGAVGVATQAGAQFFVEGKMLDLKQRTLLLTESKLLSEKDAAIAVGDKNKQALIDKALGKFYKDNEIDPLKGIFQSVTGKSQDQAIGDAVMKIGETSELSKLTNPRDKLNAYYLGLAQQADKLDKEGGFTKEITGIGSSLGYLLGLNDDMSAKRRKFWELKNQMNDLSPLVATESYNPAVSNKESYVSRMIRKTGEGITAGLVVGDNRGDKYTQVRSSLDFLQKAGLGDKIPEDINKVASEMETATYFLTEELVPMVASSVAIMAPMAATGIITQGAGKLLQVIGKLSKAEGLASALGATNTSMNIRNAVSGIGRLMDVSHRAKIVANIPTKFGRLFTNAAITGAEYGGAGFLMPSQNSELNFLAGALGGVGTKIIEKFISKIPSTLSQAFGKDFFRKTEVQTAYGKFREGTRLYLANPKATVGLLGAAGNALKQTAKSGGKELGEEFGDAIGSALTFDENGSFMKQMEDQFGSMDKVLKFIVGTLFVSTTLGGWAKDTKAFDAAQKTIASERYDSPEKSRRYEQYEKFKKMLSDTQEGLAKDIAKEAGLEGAENIPSPEGQAPSPQETADAARDAATRNAEATNALAQELAQLHDAIKTAVAENDGSPEAEQKIMDAVKAAEPGNQKQREQQAAQPELDKQAEAAQKAHDEAVKTSFDDGITGAKDGLDGQKGYVKVFSDLLTTHKKDLKNYESELEKTEKEIVKLKEAAKKPVKKGETKVDNSKEITKLNETVTGLVAKIKDLNTSLIPKTKKHVELLESALPELQNEIDERKKQKNDYGKEEPTQAATEQAAQNGENNGGTETPVEPASQQIPDSQAVPGNERDGGDGAIQVAGGQGVAGNGPGAVVVNPAEYAGNIANAGSTEQAQEVAPVSTVESATAKVADLERQLTTLKKRHADSLATMRSNALKTGKKISEETIARIGKSVQIEQTEAALAEAKAELARVQGEQPATPSPTGSDVTSVPVGDRDVFSQDQMAPDIIDLIKPFSVTIIQKTEIDGVSYNVNVYRIPKNNISDFIDALFNNQEIYGSWMGTDKMRKAIKELLKKGDLPNHIDINFLEENKGSAFLSDNSIRITGDAIYDFRETIIHELVHAAIDNKIDKYLADGKNENIKSIAKARRYIMEILFPEQNGKFSTTGAHKAKLLGISIEEVNYLKNSHILYRSPNDSYDFDEDGEYEIHEIIAGVFSMDLEHTAIRALQKIKYPPSKGGFFNMLLDFFSDLFNHKSKYERSIYKHILENSITLLGRKDKTKKTTQPQVAQGTQVPNKLAAVPVGDRDAAWFDAVKTEIEKIPVNPKTGEGYRARLDKLKELGVTTDLDIDGKLVDFIGSGARPFIFVKIGDKPVMFYRSAAGTSGKEKNAWFPVFGFGNLMPFKQSNSEKYGSSGWIVKGEVKTELSIGYGIPYLQGLQKLFKNTLNYDVDFDKNSSFDNVSAKDTKGINKIKNHPLFNDGSRILLDFDESINSNYKNDIDKTPEFVTPDDVNKALYGGVSPIIVNNNPSVERILENEEADLAAATQATPELKRHGRRMIDAMKEHMKQGVFSATQIIQKNIDEIKEQINQPQAPATQPQKAQGTQVPTTAENTDAITNFAKKIAPLFGGTVRAMTESEKLAYPGVKAMLTPQNEVVLNPSLVGMDSPAHEVAHIFINAVKDKNPVLYKRLVEIAKTDPTFAEKQADYDEAYNGDQDLIAEEVMADYLGLYMSDYLNSSPLSLALKNKWKQALQKVWDWIKTMIVRNLPAGLKNEIHTSKIFDLLEKRKGTITIGQIAGLLSGDVARGKQILTDLKEGDREMYSFMGDIGKSIGGIFKKRKPALTAKTQEAEDTQAVKELKKYVNELNDKIKQAEDKIRQTVKFEENELFKKNREIEKSLDDEMRQRDKEFDKLKSETSKKEDDIINELFKKNREIEKSLDDEMRQRDKEFDKLALSSSSEERKQSDALWIKSKKENDALLFQKKKEAETTRTEIWAKIEEERKQSDALWIKSKKENDALLFQKIKRQTEDGINNLIQHATKEWRKERDAIIESLEYDKLLLGADKASAVLNKNFKEVSDLLNSVLQTIELHDQFLADISDSNEIDPEIYDYKQTNKQTHLQGQNKESIISGIPQTNEGGISIGMTEDYLQNAGNATRQPAQQMRFSKVAGQPTFGKSAENIFDRLKHTLLFAAMKVAGLDQFGKLKKGMDVTKAAAIKLLDSAGISETSQFSKDIQKVHDVLRLLENKGGNVKALDPVNDRGIINQVNALFTSVGGKPSVWQNVTDALEKAFDAVAVEEGKSGAPYSLDETITARFLLTNMAEEIDETLRVIGEQISKSFALSSNKKLTVDEQILINNAKDTFDRTKRLNKVGISNPNAVSVVNNIFDAANGAMFAMIKATQIKMQDKMVDIGRAMNMFKEMRPRTQAYLLDEQLRSVLNDGVNSHGVVMSAKEIQAAIDKIINDPVSAEYFNDESNHGKRRKTLIEAIRKKYKLPNAPNLPAAATVSIDGLTDLELQNLVLGTPINYSDMITRMLNKIYGSVNAVVNQKKLTAEDFKNSWEGELFSELFKKAQEMFDDSAVTPNPDAMVMDADGKERKMSSLTPAERFLRLIQNQTEGAKLLQEVKDPLIEKIRKNKKFTQQQKQEAEAYINAFLGADFVPVYSGKLLKDAVREYMRSAINKNLSTLSSDNKDVREKGIQRVLFEVHTRLKQIQLQNGLEPAFADNIRAYIEDALKEQAGADIHRILLRLADVGIVKNKITGKLSSAHEAILGFLNKTTLKGKTFNAILTDPYFAPAYDLFKILDITEDDLRTLYGFAQDYDTKNPDPDVVKQVEDFLRDRQAEYKSAAKLNNPEARMKALAGMAFENSPFGETDPKQFWKRLVHEAYSIKDDVLEGMREYIISIAPGDPETVLLANQTVEYYKTKIYQQQQTELKNLYEKSLEKGDLLRNAIRGFATAGKTKLGTHEVEQWLRKINLLYSQQGKPDAVAQEVQDAIKQMIAAKLGISNMSDKEWTQWQNLLNTAQREQNPIVRKWLFMEAAAFIAYKSPTAGWNQLFTYITLNILSSGYTLSKQVFDAIITTNAIMAGELLEAVLEGKTGKAKQILQTWFRSFPQAFSKVSGALRGESTFRSADLYGDTSGEINYQPTEHSQYNKAKLSKWIENWTGIKPNAVTKIADPFFNLTWITGRIMAAVNAYVKTFTENRAFADMRWDSLQNEYEPLRQELIKNGGKTQAQANKIVNQMVAAELNGDIFGYQKDKDKWNKLAQKVGLQRIPSEKLKAQAEKLSVEEATVKAKELRDETVKNLPSDFGDTLTRNSPLWKYLFTEPSKGKMMRQGDALRRQKLAELYNKYATDAQPNSELERAENLGDIENILKPAGFFGYLSKVMFEKVAEESKFEKEDANWQKSAKLFVKIAFMFGKSLANIMDRSIDYTPGVGFANRAWLLSAAVKVEEQAKDVSLSPAKRFKLQQEAIGLRDAAHAVTKKQIASSVIMLATVSALAAINSALGTECGKWFGIPLGITGPKSTDTDFNEVNTGCPPNSLFIGKFHFSLDFAGMMATPLRVIAAIAGLDEAEDFANKRKANKKAGADATDDDEFEWYSAVLYGILATMLDKSPFMNYKNQLEAVLNIAKAKDRQKAIQAGVEAVGFWVGSMVKGFIPLSRTATDVLDTFMDKKTGKGFLGKLFAGTGVLKYLNGTKTDLFGTPIPGTDWVMNENENKPYFDLMKEKGAIKRVPDSMKDMREGENKNKPLVGADLFKAQELWKKHFKRLMDNDGLDKLRNFDGFTFKTRLNKHSTDAKKIAELELPKLK